MGLHDPWTVEAGSHLRTGHCRFELGQLLPGKNLSQGRYAVFREQAAAPIGNPYSTRSAKKSCKQQWHVHSDCSLLVECGTASEHSCKPRSGFHRVTRRSRAIPWYWPVLFSQGDCSRWSPRGFQRSARCRLTPRSCYVKIELAFISLCVLFPVRSHSLVDRRPSKNDQPCFAII